MNTGASNKVLSEKPAAGGCVTVCGQSTNEQVSSVTPRWSWRDWLGAFAVRWCVRRHNYIVQPGLYAINAPTPDSPLLVTANYKFSFDHLRRVLVNVSAWILVLDTKGINVWCAAGKGTFGTEELVRRVACTGVAERVAHRTLILPQLGAPGVAAHEVTRQSGFQVVYGPVYAKDIPAFLRDGMRASPSMRRIDFTLLERLAVVPVELVQRFIPALAVLALFCVSSGFSRLGCQFSLERIAWIALAVGANFLTGLVLFPAFLPLLPGRAFAWKGAAAGVIVGAVLAGLWPFGWIEAVSVGLLSVGACSFLGLMFTGCTPYTSVSGVRTEMRWALPLQAILTGAGAVGWFASRLV